MIEYAVMKTLVSFVLCCAAILSAQSAPEFTTRVITRGLSSPVKMHLGPDGYLWITERTGPRITRINPANGTSEVAVTIPEAHTVAGQEGVLGLALHPDLLRNTGRDYVYVVFNYDSAAGTAFDRKLAVRRYTYNQQTKTLGQPLDILTALPSGDDHIAGRITFGPDQKLYVSIGDQGANFNSNQCKVNHAQDLPTAAQVRAKDWNFYQGKILRLNLDGSIPADNPTLAGVRSHVYSYGHRNVQGMIFSPDGKLYASEHGQGSDDEVNLIEAGRNYGWPLVAGYRDDQSYVYAKWPQSKPEACATLAVAGNDMNRIPPSVPKQKETEWNSPDFREPLKTFFTVPNGYDWQKSGSATIAPSGLGLYTGNAIPGWTNSLFVLAMTKGRAYRMQLSADGKSVTGEPQELFRSQNRYRDILFAPDGRTIYLLTDGQGRTMDATGAITRTLAEPGAILELKYSGPAR